MSYKFRHPLFESDSLIAVTWRGNRQLMSLGRTRKPWTCAVCKMDYGQPGERAW